MIPLPFREHTDREHNNNVSGQRSIYFKDPKMMMFGGKANEIAWANCYTRRGRVFWMVIADCGDWCVGGPRFGRSIVHNDDGAML